MWGLACELVCKWDDSTCDGFSDICLSELQFLLFSSDLVEGAISHLCLM